MQFRKKYTNEELNKIHLDFKESKLSKYAFTKKHKIGSSTLYKAIYLNEGSKQDKDKTNVEDKLTSNVMLINSNISDALFKFALFLLASQFVFTIILLFFLS